MALLSVIRRWHHRDGMAIRKIARRTGLSRDPVIDHSKTKKFYEGNGRYIEFDGGSHQFTFFDEALPEIRNLYSSKP